MAVYSTHLQMSLCYVTSSVGLHGHTKLKRVWLYEATSVTSQTACLAVSFVLGLLSLCSFSSAISAAWRALSCLVPFFCSLYVSHAISTTPQIDVKNVAVRLPRKKKRAFIKFFTMQLLSFNKYECIYSKTYKCIHNRHHLPTTR